MIRRLLGGVLLFYAFQAQAIIINVDLTASADGTFNTGFPAGDKPIGGSACDTWTCDFYGDSSGDINEDSTTQITLSVAGTDDQEDKGLAYKEITTGNDIEVKVLVPSRDNWEGHTESFTGIGIGIAETEEVDPGDDYLAQCWLPFTGGVRFKTGTPGSYSAEVGELTETGPEWLLINYDVSATDLRCMTSSDDGVADDYELIGSARDKTLTCDPCRAYVFLTSADPENNTTATVTNLSATTTITETGEAPPEDGPRQVNHLWDWETGQFQPPGGTHDSAFIQTLPHPQTGGATILTSNGGCGEASNCDSKIVESFTVPTNGNGAGEEVLPRNGDHFLAAILWQGTHKNANEDYVVKPVSELAGGIEPPYDRKDYRDLSNGSVRNEWSNNTPANNMDFDRAYFAGLSLYFPLNWEVETGSNNASNSARVLFQNGTDSSNHMVHMDVRSDPCCSASSKTHLYFYYTTTTTAAATRIDLGDIEPRLGKWTDIVYKVRSNPCDTGTCDFGSFGTFTADQGSLEVWVSDADDDTLDENGCYSTTKVLNRIGAPVGPRVIEEDFRIQIKLYAFGWGNRATDVVGPINVNYDEISWGYVDEGTTYSDVHPNRCAAP